MENHLKFNENGIPESASLAEEIFHILDARRGEDISVIKVGEKIDITDYFVLCSAQSSTHVRSLADEVEFKLRELSVEPDAVEARSSEWVLLDYGNVIVHVFGQNARSFYNLDKLYSDATKIEITPRLAPDAGSEN